LNDGGKTMKLAEALLLRADRNRTLEQLKQRIQVSARYQEGEKPPEQARDLVSAASVALNELEGLIRNINRTNSDTVMADGRTLTDALAERDVLRLRYSMLKSSADAASGALQQVRFMRSTRSELKVVSALDVKSLRQEASDVARRARELDARIQEVNWTTELQEA
jgi:hypothetical protein